jgi:hypothetical protein
MTIEVFSGEREAGSRFRDGNYSFGALRKGVFVANAH